MYCGQTSYPTKDGFGAAICTSQSFELNALANLYALSINSVVLISKSIVTKIFFILNEFSSCNLE